MKRFAILSDNLGGLVSLYAIPRSSFVRIRREYAGGTNHLELRMLADVIEIPILYDRSFCFDEEHKITDAGDTYEISIEGQIPGIKKADEPLLRELSRGEWIVLSVDSNEHFRVAGTTVQMFFEYSSSTSKAVGGLNCTDFRFSCTQPSPAEFVDPILF